MDASLEDLTLRFEVDVISACAFCEKIICGDKFNSIEDFIEYHKSLSPNNCCTRSWKNLTITAICKQCMKNKDSCICIDCYLKGNHKGHDVSFSLSPVGTCDCGDGNAWSPLGFCSKHFNHKSEDLPSDLSDFLIRCFSASLTNFQFLATYKTEQFVYICQWIKKFSDINGSFKNIVSIVFSQKIDLSSFLINFHMYTIQSIMSALDLISSLTSNSLINKSITKSTFEILPQYMWMFLTVASEPQPKKKPIEQLIYLLKILPYGFMHANVNEMFKENFDWVQSVTKTIRLIFEFCTRDYNIKIFERTRCETIFTSINDLVSDAMEFQLQIDHIKSFASEFFVDLTAIEGHCKFERKFNEKEDDALKTETTSIHLGFHVSNIVRNLCKTDYFDESNSINALLKFLENSIFNDSFDKNREKPIFLRSTLLPGIYGTESLALHISFMLVLMKKKNKKEFMRSLFTQDGSRSFDDFVMSFSLLPLRLFAVHLQVGQDFFVHNCKSFILAIQSFTYKGNIILRLMPLFGLVQTILGIVENKEYAANSILHIFGAFDYVDNENHDEESSKEFNELILLYMFFISNVVTDRICMKLDLREYEKRSLAIALSMKHLTVTEIEKLYWPELVNSPFFKEVVDEIAEKYTDESETKYKLKDESFWIPLVPFASLNSFFSGITPFIQKNKDKIIPFPDLPDEEMDASQGLNLRGLLMTKTTFSIVYFVTYFNAHNPGSNVFSLHLAMNLLILMKKISADMPTVLPFKEDENAIVAENLSELIERIPEDFSTMISCKVKYRKNPPESFFDLLEHLGAIGFHVLSVLFPKTKSESSFVNEQEAERMKRKKISQAAKEKALKQFQNSSKFSFDDDYDDNGKESVRKRKSEFCDEEEEEEETDENNCCTICQEKKQDEQLWFPMTVFQSSLSNFESEPISNISASICAHVVHFECVKNLKPGRNFQCSFDRSIKNCILPKLPSIKRMISRSKEEKASLNDIYGNIADIFIQFFASVSSNNKRTFNYSTLLELFVGILTCIEFRDRSNPNFWKKQSNIHLLKYLFRTVWLIGKMRELEMNEKTSPIWILASQLVSCDDPSTSIESFATIIKKLLTGNDLVKFERQMCILKLSVFSKHCQNDNVRVPPSGLLRKNIIDGLIFPNMFLEFILPQYKSIPVDKYFLELGLCMFTGSLVFFKNDPETPEIAVPFEEHFNNIGGFCPILMLTGQNATSVFLFTKTFRTKVKLRPFYLTINGDDNIGLESSVLPLFFRKDVYEKMNDLIYSGEWLWKIDAQEHIDCVFDNDNEYEQENAEKYYI